MPAKMKDFDPKNKTSAMDVGMSLWDVKRKQGTKGAEYDARSIKGIRTKTKRRKVATEGYV